MYISRSPGCGILTSRPAIGDQVQNISKYSSLSNTILSSCSQDIMIKTTTEEP